MMNRYRKTLGLLLAAGMIVLTLPLQAQKQPKEFKKWPAGSSPQEIGKRVAERLIAIPHSNFGRPGPPPFITYPEVATWYGALTFAQLSGDKELDARLIKRFEPSFRRGIESDSGTGPRGPERVRHRAAGNLYPDQREESISIWG